MRLERVALILRSKKRAGGRLGRLPAVFFCGLAVHLAGCSKSTKNDVVYGEPIGIQVNDDLMVAVAAERDHDLDTAVVPELATVLAKAAKTCPDLREQLKDDTAVSLPATAKDGVLSTTAPESAEPAAKCLAGALQGQTARKLGTVKLLFQIGMKSPKKAS